jgi:hypothetical protein
MNSGACLMCINWFKDVEEKVKFIVSELVK